jgi:hypothetical protein
MEGMDKVDMLRSCYDHDRKSKKWWHRQFFTMLEIAFVNAYTIHCELYGHMSVLEFKRHVTQGLLVRGKVAPKRSRRPKQERSNVSPPPNKRRKDFSVSNDMRVQSKGAHRPEFAAERGRCEWCSVKKVQSRTN